VGTAGQVTGASAATKLFVYHTDASTPTSAFQYNDGSAEGAAIIYVGRWNFFINPQFSISLSPLLGTSSSQKCLKFSYAYTADSAYLYRYGLFCPLAGAIGRDPSSFISINYFTFPYINGVRNPTTYTCLSTKSGLLLKYHLDSSKNNLQPNTLTISAQSTDLPFGQIS
jgi:hypothetical protein